MKRLLRVVLLALLLVTPAESQPISGQPVGVDAACELAQTATAAASAGVTLTLPAGGARTFHYLCLVEITMFATAALTAAATPVLVTTTNLANTPTFSLSASAMAQGTVEERLYSPAVHVKSAVANTTTTIVAPPTTNVIWRLNVFYHLGP